MFNFAGSFFSIVLNHSLLSLTGSRKTFVSVFCSPLFCFLVCLFLKKLIICNFMLATTLIVHLALILHFFVLFGSKLKSVFLFGPLQVISAIMSTSGTMTPSSHKICIFALLFIFFWTNDAIVFFSSSTFAQQVSDIFQFPSIISPFTCIPASWYTLMIRYYPINLSWSAF